MSCRWAGVIGSLRGRGARSQGVLVLGKEDGAAVLEELRAELASLADRNRRLEHLVRELRRLVYGKKSEKLHPDQLQLAFEALEGAVGELEQSTPASPTSAPGRRPRAPERNLGHLPEHLPRFEQVIEPQSTHCPCGCGEMVRIGEDRTERLDIVPAQLRIIVTVCPKCACRVCEEGVSQAPARVIEGGLPPEGALAHVLVSKFADRLPLVLGPIRHHLPQVRAWGRQPRSSGPESLLQQACNRARVHGDARLKTRNYGAEIPCRPEPARRAHHDAGRGASQRIGTSRVHSTGGPQSRARDGSHARAQKRDPERSGGTRLGPGERLRGRSSISV